MSRTPSRNGVTARLLVTALEGRSLPASGIISSLNNGLLRITDWKPSDHVVVKQSASNVTIEAIDTHLVFVGVNRIIADVQYSDTITNDTGAMGGTPARSVYLSRRDSQGTGFYSSGDLPAGATSSPPSTPTTPVPPAQSSPSASNPAVTTSLSNGILRVNDWKRRDTLTIIQSPSGVTIQAFGTNQTFSNVSRLILDVQYDATVINDTSSMGSASPRSVYLNRRNASGTGFYSSSNLPAGATSLPPGTPSTPPTSQDWFDVSLNDPGVRSAARSAASNGTIDRIEMLGLLNQVASDGVVSSNEIHDVKALLRPDWTAGGTMANTQQFSMPDAVRSLTSNIVDGDLANATYQGTPLGNLQAGSSGAHLQKLVNKWFLGLDRPQNAGGTTYRQVNGMLFVSGPAVSDVKQGQVGDCYLLAALAELAQDRNSAIRDMFTDNGDGTFTVRFYNNGVAEYVTVDRYLPVYSSGTAQYASFGGVYSSSSNELWVALAEKAYAQLNQSGWIGQDGSNSYAGIADGYTDTVMTQITGQAASWRYMVSLTLSELISAANSGRPTALNSRSNPATGIVASHSYPLIGYDSTTQQFKLYNPQGSYIQLSWSQITQNFLGVWQMSA